MIGDSSIRRAITVDDRRLAERHARGCVSAIDDDAEFLAALRALIELEGYGCETYGSALDYLGERAWERPRFPGPRCLLCDVRLPGLDGLGLQRRLAECEDIPVVLMSGACGASEAIRAFHAGALDFLLKPIDADLLLGAVAKALAQSAQRQAQRARREALAHRLAALTERELEVARLVALGQHNAEIAQALGIALRTVKRHRHQVMEKLAAETLVDLVRIVDELKAHAPALA